jgi:lipopolysaccharide/colanic/teichoic acid biosynthesis glycosyltransferase
VNGNGHAPAPPVVHGEGAVSADPLERLRLARGTGGSNGARRRPAARQRLGLTDARVPESLARRAALARGRVAGPALAAMLAALLFSGPGQAIVLGSLVALLALPLRRFPMPLHLMPATRLTLALAPAAIGCGIFALADVFGPQPFSIGAGEALMCGLIAAEAALLIELFGPRWLRRRPMRIATLGAPQFALALARELLETGIEEATLVGWIDQSDPNSLRDIVLEHRIDLVVRVSGGPRGTRSDRVAGEEGLSVLLDLPVRTVGADQLYEDLFGHVPMGTIDARWYLFLMHPQFNTPRPATDRALELAVAVPLLLLFAPVLGLAALAIKLTDRGPVLYRQTRVGAGGREFEILKLRTMSTGAQRDGARWASANDARVTGVGRLLRRLHLDEIPQLVNVLRGEMTLVGPRPEQPAMVSELERTFPHYRRRHLIKPGVTGWAQVRCGYAGSTLGTAWKLCHDLYYLKRRSRLVNLMIVLETVVIAGLDSHRPMRAPSSQFLFGADLGIDLSEDARGSLPPELADRGEPLQPVAS